MVIPVFKLKNLTKDEISLLMGAVMCAGVSGIGIYQLYIARIVPTLPEYIWFMITGAMLFNAGIAGITAIGAIWYNYQALL